MYLKQFLFSCLLFFFSQAGSAQLISNGNFSSGTTSWGCGIEVNTESTYGGSGSNAVVEVDAGLTIGNTYLLSFSASRRTGGCPSPATTNIDITVSGGVFAATVTRTNTTFGFTFEGQLQNNQISFNWATASEKNNSYFEIERSENGALFTSIGKIDSKSIGGNSAVKLSYESNDLAPQNGTNYYRLKEVDFDNTFSYSKVIAVTMDTKPTTTSKLYPNPNTGEFIIDMGSPRNAQISIFDRFGKIVHSQQQNIDKGSNLVHINTNHNLTSGLYQCLVTSENYNQNFHLIIE